MTILQIDGNILIQCVLHWLLNSGINDQCTNHVCTAAVFGSCSLLTITTPGFTIEDFSSLNNKLHKHQIVLYMICVHVWLIVWPGDLENKNMEKYITGWYERSIF